LRMEDRVRTISDIARIAQVSGSTVSRALADSPLVAEETRRKIQEIARAHSFSINQSARNLRLQRSRAVEVVIPHGDAPASRISDQFMLEILGAIADAVAERDHETVVSRIAPWSPRWGQSGLMTGRADALILIGQGSQHHFIEAEARKGLKLVVWGADIPGHTYSVVGSDNALGGKLATRHLIEVGRRNIVFLGDETLPEVSQRAAGYRAEMKAAKLRERVEHCEFSMGAAEALAKRLHAADGKIDGFVCASDTIALGAIKALAEAGVAVPDQVSVTGYDDIILASFATPALTTVRQNIALGGETLAAAAFALIEGEKPASRMLPTTLEVRGSSVPKR
jgi:DNA-binding LacI/PurR family transcriptional regulator